MKIKEVLAEAAIRKRVVRKGVMKWIKVSTLPNHKIVSGREVYMPYSERLKREISGRKAARLRKGKMALILTRRKISMMKRPK